MDDIMNGMYTGGSDSEEKILESDEEILGADESDAELDDLFRMLTKDREDEKEDAGENEPDIGEFLRQLFDDGNNDDEMPDNDLDADDYHNKAVDMARRNCKKKAADICCEGLEKFPKNVDLLADVIQYASSCGDLERAESYYQRLKKTVPVQSWNWRAFTFSIDYLVKNAVDNEAECRKLLEYYHKYFPMEQRAYMASSELEGALGNYELSKSILEDAISKLNNASQCALRLADMQMDCGDYEAVIKTAEYGLAAVEVQHSINLPYLLLLRAMAKDHFLFKKCCMEPDSVSDEEIQAVNDKYGKMVKKFPSLIQHLPDIELRSNLLDFIR